MVGCLVLKGEERDNATRVNKLQFSQTICDGVVIKDGLARLPDPQSTVRLDSVTTPITRADIKSDKAVLDAIDSTLGIAEIILSNSVIVEQSKLAWAFVQWLGTFITPVGSYMASSWLTNICHWHLGALEQASGKRGHLYLSAELFLFCIAGVYLCLCSVVFMYASCGRSAVEETRKFMHSCIPPCASLHALQQQIKGQR